jgi:soluble P-type ATPase
MPRPAGDFCLTDIDFSYILSLSYTMYSDIKKNIRQDNNINVEVWIASGYALAMTAAAI